MMFGIYTRCFSPLHEKKGQRFGGDATAPWWEKPGIIPVIIPDEGKIQVKYGL